MGDPLITVLIVNYNGRRHLPACLAALAAQTLPRHRFEVVVVDNASRDGSVEWLHREHPWVRVVARPDNAGFAGGNNAGVPFARGRVVRSPIAFPLAGGQVGIAGERGAEAILPLSRGPDGRLGVAAQGGGGVNVVFNVTTPDADSFQRSESQVAAMLARAVALGQRNL